MRTALDFILHTLTLNMKLARVVYFVRLPDAHVVYFVRLPDAHVAYLIYLIFFYFIDFL